MVVDPWGRVSVWNTGAESILRWPSGDVLGADAISTTVAPSYQEAARKLVHRIRREGGWEGTVPLQRKDGQTRLCALRARGLRDVDGTPTGEILVVFSELPSSSGSSSETSAANERAALLRAERAAREELESVRDRLAFIVHASSRLASSLDVGMTLETVGDLVVPRFGRVCLIDLWDGRRLERVYVRDAESDRDDLVAQLRTLGGTQREDHPGIRAVLTGRPCVVAVTDPAQVARMYDDPRAAELINRAAQGRGFVAVPLITRGRVIGVLTLLGPGVAHGHELDPAEDLPVLEQVATRAAQSIENARLFDAERRLARNLQESERRQRRAALTLQRSLLPAWPHQPAELEVATRYFPGAEEAEVGGDWYDVIPVSSGRTALVIGDVMGRGLRAATLMGQVRTAVRAYARQDLPPKEILELLDGVVADLGEAQIVTCVYALFDSLRGTLTYASAGHMPLLIVDARGRARRLDHESGLPLGVARCAAPEHVVAVPANTMVVFYTDGLVEHRQRDVDSGIDELVDSLARASGTLEGVCDQVIDDLRPPTGYDDDVALLLARARDPATSPPPTAVPSATASAPPAS